ncbi:MAG: sugar nucleotide-binding protein [Nitrospirota bacterium]|nr:MAG: sugar nucleotide-binding protein [Nitrospirota bacterium]
MLITSTKQEKMCDRIPVSTLLFGASSILGFHLATLFPKTIAPFISPGNTSRAVRHWPSLQLSDSQWLEKLFHRTQPNILVYCHAVCDVPKCEAYPDWAYEVNVQQVERVIAALPGHTRLVYVSSDHVFGGDGVYSEESSLCPISVYGWTRVEAERLVLRRAGSLVIRTSLGIGPSPNGRTGHLDWLRYRILHNLPITIIEDEYRSVVWMWELATRVLTLARSEEAGLRHISATRAVSRVDLANYLLNLLGKPATFKIECRHQQRTPHLGRVELDSVYEGELFRPLTSVLDG